MDKKKGFTLVELLAVIVILALIALIATPIILNIIKDAKRSAALESLKGYIDGSEKAIMMNKIKEDSTFPKTDENGCYDVKKLDEKVNIKGTRPVIEEGAKLCVKDGATTSVEGLIFNGYKVEYKNGKYIINEKIVEKEDNKDLTGIQNQEYTQGKKVSYLGYNWLVMKDNGNNTQLVMDGYLDDDEVDENYPTDIDQSFKTKGYHFCLYLDKDKRDSDYEEERNKFLSKVGNYCYTIWNGGDDEISGYTWNKSITKRILENWIDSKMSEEGLNKKIELKEMSFTDGIEQTIGYVRIPTYDELNPVGDTYSIKINNYMSADYNYFLLTAKQAASEHYQLIYKYDADCGVYPSEMGNIEKDKTQIRPVIIVNEK